MRQRMEDEDLTDSTACREREHIPSNGGICGHEAERFFELAAVLGAEAEEGAEGRAGDEGGEEEERDGENGGDDVLRAHHLGSREAFECAEDVVLDCVGEAVEEKVDTEEEKSEFIDKAKSATKQKLARHNVPRYFVFLDKLPRNAVGKVVPRELPQPDAQ